MSDHPRRLPYDELSPEGVAAMHALEHYLNAFSGLERDLLKIVRFRVSLVNGCEFCIGLHRTELEKGHVPASLIAAMTDWRRSDAFTHRQRAALLWADAITNIQGSHASDVEYASMEEYFSHREIVDLTLAISSINAWNRLAIAFRYRWKPSQRGSAQNRPDRNEQAVAAAIDEPEVVRSKPREHS